LCTQSLGPLSLAVSEIWDLKVPIAADTDRYLSAVTFPLNILPCEVGSLWAQGFGSYGNLKFYYKESLFIQYRYGLEKSMEKWLERQC